MRNFYCDGILDTAQWRPDFDCISREELMTELEGDGTAAGLREDATMLGQNPEAAVRDYVSGMIYTISRELEWEDARIHALSINSGLSLGAAEILLQVRRAMQPAEEIGGPEGEDYLKLMRAIATDANTRAKDYAHILMESRP